MSRSLIQVGYVLRSEDASGVSGTGKVAEFVEFSNGRVVVQWLSHTPSVNIYENMKQALGIHGHGGKTEFKTYWTSESEPEDEEQVDDVRGGKAAE